MTGSRLHCCFVSLAGHNPAFFYAREKKLNNNFKKYLVIRLPFINLGY